MNSFIPSIDSDNSSPSYVITNPAKQQDLNGRRITTISQHFTSPTSIVKVVVVALIICFFISEVAAVAGNWNCPTPQGSYLQSCDSPIGYPYQSTDPYLKDVKFCNYNISCKKVGRPDHDKRSSFKVLPREDLACGKNWENCDGYLIGRAGGEDRKCTDWETIQSELYKHIFMAEKSDL